MAGGERHSDRAVHERAEAVMVEKLDSAKLYIIGKLGPPGHLEGRKFGFSFGHEFLLNFAQGTIYNLYIQPSHALEHRRRGCADGGHVRRLVARSFNPELSVVSQAP